MFDAGPFRHAQEERAPARVARKQGGRIAVEEAVHVVRRHSRRDAVDEGFGHAILPGPCIAANEATIGFRPESGEPGSLGQAPAL